MRDEQGHLVNTPYVDISYKWAGGGLVSTTEDLAKFGTAMLACYQQSETTNVRTSEASKTDFSATKYKLLLEPSTTAMMWKPAATDVNPLFDYGMGWYVSQEQQEIVCGKKRPMLIGHGGRAVGSSSVLLISPCDSSVPEQDQKISSVHKELQPFPCGVVVAVFFNLQDVEGVYSLGVQIAEEFM